MNRRLEYIFGPESAGQAARERAKTSRLIFVRGQDHLALASADATGRRLTALEAFDACGLHRLEEVMEYGSAILPASGDEPASTLRRRRESLGLSQQHVAKAAGLDVDDVNDCEDSSTRSPIRNIEKIAIALGLDERMISIQPGAGGEVQLAARLKTLGFVKNTLSAGTVSTLAEAAWVIRTQARFRQLLGIPDKKTSFPRSDNYGSREYPVWEHGYFLASQTRKALGIADRDRIPSMRELCEALGIPLLQAALPTGIAGATIVSAGSRGIVVNTNGFNSNVWVRRATIAHELGHLLWDPEEHLEAIKVDDYAEITDLERDRPDYVEARANAFAVEFIAPRAAAAELFCKNSNATLGLREVMEFFGISRTAARYHLRNALDKDIEVDGLRNAQIDLHPTDDWSGREAFTDDYFPLPDTPSLRRGVFSKLVVEAEQRRLISSDTACSYLQATPEGYKTKAGEIAGLFSIDGLPPAEPW